MITDEYIAKIELAIQRSNEKEQKDLLEEIFSVFKNDIPNIRSGTTYESSVINIVLNANEVGEPLPTTCDYDRDLRLVLAKLKQHRESEELRKPVQTIVNNSTNINISDSVVKDSNIASTVNNPIPKKRIVATIFGAIVGLATIIGTIIAIIQLLQHNGQ